MRRFLGCFHTDLKRAFLSPRFLFALLGMCLLLFLSVSGDLLSASQSDLSVYSLNLVAPLGFTSAAYLLCSLPYSDGFCSDWNSRYVRLCCVRSGARPYAFSKLISAALSGGCAVCGGYLLFYLLLSARLPLVHAADMGNIRGEASFALGGLLTGGQMVSYFLCLVLLRFAAGALFASVGFLFSTLLPNRYIVWFGPLLAYYVLINLGHAASMPGPLDVYRLYNGYFNLGGALPSVLYVLALTILLCGLLGAAGLKSIKVRLQHE